EAPQSARIAQGPDHVAANYKIVVVSVGVLTGRLVGIAVERRGERQPVVDCVLQGLLACIVGWSVDRALARVAPVEDFHSAGILASEQQGQRLRLEYGALVVAVVKRSDAAALFGRARAHVSLLPCK